MSESRKVYQPSVAQKEPSLSKNLIRRNWWVLSKGTNEKAQPIPIYIQTYQFHRLKNSLSYNNC
uniref:Uncharacterized protein n=1 Tax=Lepeophtheirus salmonis TaxID=72036 RepID=A0A0K2V6T6_LEPSM